MTWTVPLDVYGNPLNAPQRLREYRLDTRQGIGFIWVNRDSPNIYHFRVYTRDEGMMESSHWSQTRVVEAVCDILEAGPEDEVLPVWEEALAWSRTLQQTAIEHGARAVPGGVS